mmetsp:Transcript_55624/g.180493  ORF Transcript_55624/g.180493 Transcript_55624/m.180493 type:complete len:303 (-) Transcript_55624:442-1350(-)
MASTCSAGRTESEKWNTTPKLSSSLSCCAAPPGVLGGVRPFLAATPTPSKGLRRGTCQRRLPPNNCRIWAAGRVTLDAILYSCQAFRRWSPAHFASQDMRLSKSGGKLTSTARALWAPKMCCRRAIAVTSSTPAGIASPTSVCCRANMPMEPCLLDPSPCHHLFVPMVKPSSNSRSSSSVLCRLFGSTSPENCRVGCQRPPSGTISSWSPSVSPVICLAMLARLACGMPSAMLKNPVKPSLRTFQSAKVFQGADRPFRGCSPSSKTWPSSMGPTTRVSLVKWSSNLLSTGLAQQTSNDWYRM